MTIITISIIAIVAAVILMAASNSIMFAIIKRGVVKAMDMDRKAALAVAEDACRCKACVKRIIAENARKEAEMYQQIMTDPAAFRAEIARSNQNNTMAMVWAEAMVKEVNNAVKAAN